MKSRIFTSLLAIAILTALLAPTSVAQDATTRAKKAQLNTMAPSQGKTAVMTSEDTGSQPLSCAATVNALKDSADYLIADNRLKDPLFRGEQPPRCGFYPRCSGHVRNCRFCNYCYRGFLLNCYDLQYHRTCSVCTGWLPNGDDVQSDPGSKP